MGVSQDNRINHILFLRGHTAAALTTSILLLEIVLQDTLYIALSREQDNAFLIWNQIFLSELTDLMINNLTAAWITVLLFHNKEFFLDNIKNSLFGCEDCLEFLDKLMELVQLVLNLIALETLEAAKLHRKDSGCLYL